MKQGLLALYTAFGIIFHVGKTKDFKNKLLTFWLSPSESRDLEFFSPTRVLEKISMELWSLCIFLLYRSKKQDRVATTILWKSAVFRALFLSHTESESDWI